MDSHSGYACTSTLGIEILLIIFLFMIVIAAALSEMRRHLSSAFNLFLPLMSYTFSQVKQQDIFNPRIQLILTWMVFTELIRQQMGTTSTGKLFPKTSCTKKLFASVEQLARTGWVCYLVFTYAPLHGLRIPLFILCVSSITYEVLMCVAFIKAKGSDLMGHYPEIIGNQVKRVVVRGDLRTTPLDRCGYIVSGEETQEIEASPNGYRISQKEPETEGLLTIGRVFEPRTEDRAFTLAHPNWRNLCLSFALAKMLMRRFAMLPLDEDGSEKALNFVLEGLIDYIGSNRDLQQDENPPQEESNRESNRAERIFGILTEELEIVADFLHTKVLMYQIFDWVCKVDLAFNFISCAAMLSSVYTILIRFRSTFLIDSKKFKSLCGNAHINLGLNFLDFIIIIYLFPAFGYVMLNYICDQQKLETLGHIKTYVTNPAQWKEPINDRHSTVSTKNSSIISKLIKKIMSQQNQHSLPRITIGFPYFTIGRLDRAFCAKVGVTAITTDVKEAVLTSLKESGGKLTNGESSLRRHEMIHLKWACQPNESTTEAILVWHLATILFEHQNPLPQQDNDPLKNPLSQQDNDPLKNSPPQQDNDPLENPPPQQDNDLLKKERGVVLTLSCYCHNLVASFPELLPDDVEWTERTYENWKREILGFVRSSGYSLPVSSLCDRLVLKTDWDADSVVGKAVKLAKDLMDVRDRVLVWKMLAEFWSEMMLFIAPSENVEAHEKILQRGFKFLPSIPMRLAVIDKGEFITQIWALLTHAGILTRPKSPLHTIV